MVAERVKNLVVIFLTVRIFINAKTSKVLIFFIENIVAWITKMTKFLNTELESESESESDIELELNSESKT